MELIIALISLIALVVFFVMAYNLGTIASQSTYQTKLLGDILSSLSDTTNWFHHQLAEVEKAKGNNPLALEKYKEAKYWLEKKISETKDKKVLFTLNERLDGLNRIIDKLES